MRLGGHVCVLNGTDAHPKSHICASNPARIAQERMAHPLRVDSKTALSDPIKTLHSPNPSQNPPPRPDSAPRSRPQTNPGPRPR